MPSPEAAPLPSWSTRRRQPLRVGVPKGPIPFFGDKDYEALYHAAIDRLAALGAGIVPIDFTPFAKAASMLYAGPWVAERLVAIGDLADAEPRGDP